MDESVDMVEALLNLSHFYAHESCGQCTPCREGGHWVEKILTRVNEKQGVPGDIELIESIVKQIAGHTICVFGEAIAWPVQSFIARFPEEFRGKITV